MGKLRFRATGSELTPQTLALSSFPSLEFDCEEGNTYNRETKRLGMTEGVWWAGLYKQEAEGTESAWEHPSTPESGGPPGGIQGASATGFTGALAAPTTRRRQSSVYAPLAGPGWNLRSGPEMQPRASDPDFWEPPGSRMLRPVDWKLFKGHPDSASRRVRSYFQHPELS